MNLKLNLNIETEALKLELNMKPKLVLPLQLLDLLPMVGFQTIAVPWLDITSVRLSKAAYLRPSI